MARASRPADDVHVAGAVVIVDDNARFRTRARRTLEAAGYVVVAEAGDGTGALEAVRHDRPDIVLLDVELPDMSGLAVAERVTRAPGAPAVVLTSVRDVADLGDRVYRCGARGFVPKAALSGAALADILS